MTQFVIPAKVGIQFFGGCLDSRIRGNDEDPLRMPVFETSSVTGASRFPGYNETQSFQMIAIVSTETLMRAQRIFRIFVSSTFGDFQAEREALRAKVWPELQNFCRAQGGDFQAVDLRWGVNESAGLEHETMKICLDEIAHCQRLSPRPNFLLLIGDRYGWRPFPPAIPAEECTAIWECYAEDAEAQALLKCWYRRDENAVPVEYVLQPRPQNYAEWSPVEIRLLALLRDAAQTLGIAPERRERYFCRRLTWRLYVAR